MSLISGRRRTATARAIGPTRIIEIPRKAILKLLGAAPRAKALVDQAFLLRAFGGYLFPGIPEAQLGELVELAMVETLGKDAVVFKEGDPADAFYLIRNGMVKISKKSGEKEVVLSYLVAGNFFGEAALFSDARAHRDRDDDLPVRSDQAVEDATSTISWPRIPICARRRCGSSRSAASPA